MSIEIKVQHAQDDFELVANALVPSNGITGIFGESGSGKTTLARIIAGLESNAQGLVRFGDTIWQDTSKNIFVPTHKRRVGFVFQGSGLFSHLNVRQNLEFGYHRRQDPNPELEINQIIDLFDLSLLLDRAPMNLSGGELQRTVIAQVILGQPRVLIMDEPMTALDLRRRREAILYIEKLHSSLKIPILYITHSVRELERLADSLITIQNGTVTTVNDIANHLAVLKLEDF